MEYQVNDVFDAPQGEGVRAGIWSHFIRLQGCPVGCPWCDSKDTWGKVGKTMTEDELTAGLKGFQGQIVITGGEPFYQDIGPLVTRLRLWNKYIQIETSGFSDFKHPVSWLGFGRRAWITWSPKPKLDFKYNRPMMRELIYEVKFVVDESLTEKDIVRALGLVPRSALVTLMPEGFPPTEKSYARTLKLYKTLIQDGYEQFTGRIRLTDRLQCHYGVK